MRYFAILSLPHLWGQMYKLTASDITFGLAVKGNFRQVTFRGHYKTQASKHLFFATNDNKKQLESSFPNSPTAYIPIILNSKIELIPTNTRPH